MHNPTLTAAPDMPYVVQLRSLLLMLQGDHAGGIAALGDLDLTAFDGHPTFHFTEIFAMTGDIERAMEILKLAVEKGFSPVAFIAKHRPLIEPLRAHSKFRAIAQKATE